MQGVVAGGAADGAAAVGADQVRSNELKRDLQRHMALLAVKGFTFLCEFLYHAPRLVFGSTFLASMAPSAAHPTATFGRSQSSASFPKKAVTCLFIPIFPFFL
jgi:hypothetical protein